MQVKKGFFITIEGIEGVGKSTALQYIHNQLTQAKLKFILTREPGGTIIAEQIRKVLLTPDQEELMTSETELLLMMAARSQHISRVIKPALASGKWVVSDRFSDATFAYQGGGRGLPMQQIEMLDKWIVHDLKPDVTFLLDASPEIGLARAKSRGGSHDRIEQEKLSFFERVRAGYLYRAERDKKRFRIIDATQPLDVVQGEIKIILDQMMYK